MSELDDDDVTYSREETITAVSGYYRFLTTMYMNDSQVIYPPKGGWPSIINADPAFLRALGKTDEVISLLAHLPYIRRPDNWTNDADAIPWNRFADWQELLSHHSSHHSVLMEEDAEDIRLITEGATFSELAPPHVFSLTCGDRETPAIILDTELGIIHWENCSDRIVVDHFATTFDWDLDDDVPQEEAGWRHDATAWPIPDFFEVLKEQFINLHWVPISAQSVRFADGCNRPHEVGMMPMLQDIYRQHGWPDLDLYGKAECLATVRKALMERYPNNLCFREDINEP